MHRCFSQIALFFLLTAAASKGYGQQPSAEAVHWAYSSYFGTGWYQINDAQNAFVLRYTPHTVLSEATFDDDGSRRSGIEFRFPVTIGLNHFPLDDLRGSVDPENLANISVTPAVYLTWPANDRWTLRPFAAFGGGTLLNGEGSAWNYWAGVRSRFMLADGERELALINSIGFVGYSPSEGSSSNFWPLMSGLELRHPVFRDRGDAKKWQLHWHAAYTFFQDDLDLVGRNLASAPISDQWEIGVALGREDAPISVWKFAFDRLGLSYRFSSDGDLQGIGLVFSSLFDQ